MITFQTRFELMNAEDTRLTRADHVADLAIVITTLIVSKSLLLQWDAVWKYAGPISLLLTLGVASWRLNVRKTNWSRLGLAWPGSWRFLGLWTLLAFVVTVLAGSFVEGVFSSVSEQMPVNAEVATRYSDRFADLPGNMPMLILWIGIGWVIGGFTEEILFRGFLFNKCEMALRGLPGTVIVAILIQSILFGQQHFYYQGLGGALATGTLAAISGLIYLFGRRNLWALILSHGLANTLGMTMLYLQG